jgi:alpha-tubulin suppressor-like RCC1 family protein
MIMKPHPLFLNILLIGVFSFSLLTPEDASRASPEHVSGEAPEHVFGEAPELRRSGVTPLARMLMMNTPDTLAPLLNIAAITAGDAHTCALTTGGGVKCWGDNGYGQLGDGTTTDRHTPVNVSGLASGVSAITTGYNHTCALTAGGGVKCWGRNSRGQLGDGTITDRLTPVNVNGLASGVSAIAAGGLHTCARTASGGVKCWGYNYYGQLGDGTTTDRQTPVNVSGLASGVSAITAGGGHTCARTSGGGVKCWGDNWYGQLGDGTTTERHKPVGVSGLASGVSAITGGGSHTCALTAGGGVKCWGQNWYGQLGDGTTTDRHVPVNVSGLASGVSAIAARYYHTCALTSVGGVKCWGSNLSGQLGDGTTTDRHTPVNVSGLASGVSAIAAGDYHTCGRTAGGGVKCWGWNVCGQLGDGTTTDRHTPVDVVVATLTKSYRSQAAHDGWVRESNETSGKGYTGNSAAMVFYLGDDASNRQYRSILSFDTASLPNNAVLTKVTLKIKKQGLVGSNPFSTHQGLLVDIKKPYFGTALALAAHDFQATANKLAVGTFGTTASSGWYSVTLLNAAYPYINRTGTTQFRLRFKLDDDNDNTADYMKFFSGNYGTATDRPVLVIQYYVP